MTYLNLVLEVFRIDIVLLKLAKQCDLCHLGLLGSHVDPATVCFKSSSNKLFQTFLEHWIFQVLFFDQRKQGRTFVRLRMDRCLNPKKVDVNHVLHSVWFDCFL